MKSRLIITAAVLAATGCGWLVWHGAVPAALLAGTGPAATPQGQAASGASPAGAKWLQALPETPERELVRVPLPPVDSSSPAWISLAAARENGDPRTPPVQRDAATRLPPTQAQLADPMAYQQYENSQQTRLLSSFITAAASELPKLQADLERGRQAGVSPEQLAKVEEKIARIQHLSAGIVRDHPEVRPAVPH